MWEAAFVATCIALGESVDDAAEAIGPAGEAPLAALHLRSENRARKARALALELGAVMLEIESLGVAWPS